MRAALVVVALAVLALPQAAQAHAELVSASPERGVGLDQAPREVNLRFNEPVEAAFGAVRVFDAQGRRVDTGGLVRAAGEATEVGTRLEANLEDGAYTVTYRVLSADAHPVSGGYVFNLGEGRAAAAVPVSHLTDAAGSGPVTSVGFGVVRVSSYIATALAVGGLIFLVLVWLPALRAVGGATPGWRQASEALAARFLQLAGATVALGLVAGVLGIALQGATAAGIDMWSAMQPALFADVLGTRFGMVWGLRELAWLSLGVAVLAARGGARVPVLRPASLGASGLALSASKPMVLALLALPLAVLVVSPALSGHASATEPTALLIGADGLHVLAMSVWTGGLAALLLALPAATRRLPAPERTRLLAACLRRFSPLALASVAVLLATGVGQSLAHLESLADLTGSAFGRAILVKAVLLLALVGLGAFNLRGSRPRLERIAAEGGSPGEAGRALRRTIAAETLLLVAVLGVTAALTSYPPPSAAGAGPFSASARLGSARMEVTVDPASTGPNEIHLYMFDRRDGSQYDRAKEVRVWLILPDRRIGPLEPRVDKAGPGHYVARRALIAAPGDWRLKVSARVSEFAEDRVQLEVPVR